MITVEYNNVRYEVRDKQLAFILANASAHDDMLHKLPPLPSCKTCMKSGGVCTFSLKDGVDCASVCRNYIKAPQMEKNNGKQKA